MKYSSSKLNLEVQLLYYYNCATGSVLGLAIILDCV